MKSGKPFVLFAALTAQPLLPMPVGTPSSCQTALADSSEIPSASSDAPASCAECGGAGRARGPIAPSTGTLVGASGSLIHRRSLNMPSPAVVGSGSPFAALAACRLVSSVPLARSPPPASPNSRAMNVNSRTSSRTVHWSGTPRPKA